MENTSFYTYLHCRPDGSPFYVGKGRGKRSHNFHSRNTYHKNIVAKYGRENIGIYVFPCESEEQAHADEIQQITQLRLEGHVLANLCDGGQGQSGNSPTVETRLKISTSNKGKKKAPEHCRQLSLSHVGNKHPAHVRAKISAALIGNSRAAGTKATVEQLAKKAAKMTMEVRARISVKLKGRKLPAETRRKMSAAGKRKTFSAEHRLNLSIAAKARCARNK